MAADVQYETVSALIVQPKDGVDKQAWYFLNTYGNRFRLRIGYILAAALNKRHEQNRFFGCLKPENVGITSRSPVKLSLYRPELDYDTLPLEYADPLVLSGTRPLSAKSETYSYAVILFEMLTQCHPFKGMKYESCTEEEREAGLRSGSFDYIGDYTCDNTNDEFEYVSHFHLNEELSDLFYRMFVTGKTDEGKRPLLKDFISVILKGTRLTLLCDHGSYEAEYYGEKSFSCPYCKKVNKPLATLSSWKRVFSSRPVLIPDSLEGDLAPVATERVLLNKMYMLATDCKVTRSFFESDVPDTADFICAEVGIHQSSLHIKNCLKTLDVTVGNGKNKQEIAPGEKYTSSKDWDEVVVSFKPDLYMNQVGEDLLDIDDPVYGLIKIRYYMLIEKGDQQ